MPIYERMTIQGRGGALPQYQSNQTPYVPGQGVTARLSDARGQLEGAGQQAKYKALAGLGKAVDGAVDVGLQAYEDYSKTKATELVTKYKMGMRQSMYGEGGILTREGDAAFTANADTMKRSKEMRAELLKDMGGSRVEQIFNQLIDPEEAEYSLKAQEYEGKQYRVYQDRTDTAAFNEAAESAMYGYADGKTWAKGVGEALYFQKQMLMRKGYSGEALERGLKESGSKIFAGGIEQALAANDLAAARRLLKQGEGSRMTAEDAAKARKAIDAKAEALERKAEANRNKAGKAIMAGYADAEYKAKNMGDVSTLEGMAAELGKLGLTDEAEKCRNAAETWRGMEDVSKLSLPELAQKIESATGSMKAEKDVDAHRRLSTQTKAMLDVYNHRFKALNADPALVADTAPDIALPDQPSEADKFAARMEWQEKNGVPADMAVPLTKSEAGYLGQQYTQSAQPVQFLAEMRTTYGDMYQPVLKQLVTSGAIPPTANLVADMEPEAGQYLAQASRKDYEKETETALGIEKADKNAMKASLQEHLAESIGTLAASGDAAAGSRILDAGYRLALRYRELGMDADDATEKAAQDVFASRYAVRGSYRVPKRFNDDDVDAGAQAYVENLDTSDILVGLSDEAKAMKPEALALLMRRTIALSGRWVTNRDESGLILTVGGAPVRLKSGGRVEVTFEELEHLGLTGSEE